MTICFNLSHKMSIFLIYPGTIIRYLLQDLESTEDRLYQEACNPPSPRLTTLQVKFRAYNTCFMYANDFTNSNDITKNRLCMACYDF